MSLFGFLKRKKATADPVVVGYLRTAIRNSKKLGKAKFTMWLEGSDIGTVFTESLNAVNGDGRFKAEFGEWAVVYKVPSLRDGVGGVEYALIRQ